MADATTPAQRDDNTLREHALNAAAGATNWFEKFLTQVRNPAKFFGLSRLGSNGQLAIRDDDGTMTPLNNTYSKLKWEQLAKELHMTVQQLVEATIVRYIEEIRVEREAIEATPVRRDSDRQLRGVRVREHDDNTDVSTRDASAGVQPGGASRRGAAEAA
jgi:hypothetical protein